MKPNLLFKYLNYLQQKNKQQGRVKLEFILVALIVLILLVIFLNSFIPYLSKQMSKISDKLLLYYLYDIYSAQRLYHLQYQTFANEIGNLGINSPSQKFVKFSNTKSKVFKPIINLKNINILMTVHSKSVNLQVENSNALNDGTHVYSGRLVYEDGKYFQILCQSDTIATKLEAPTGGVGSLKCPPDSTQMY